MIKHICIAGLLLSLLTLGCLSRDSLTDRQSFLLETPTSTVQSGKTLPGRLKIRHCRATAPFDSPYFLYRTQAGQYQQDFYRLFLTPPNEQMAEQIRSWLSASRLFSEVLPASSGAEAQYSLEPNLLAIYCDVSDAANPRTVVRMHWVLLKQSPDRNDPEILLEKTYESIKALQAKTGSDIAANYSISLGDIFTRLSTDIINCLK